MAYSIIYNNDDVNADTITLLGYINDFTKGLGVGFVTIEPDVCTSILLGMRLDFPHKDGLDRASVFKKVANFVTYFVTQKPILYPFPAEVIGENLSEISNHQNIMVAFQIAVDSLEGAIINGHGGDVKLTNRIKLSLHSYIDIIDALSEITPSTHFKTVTVLLEQLAYKTNPDCQYPLINI